MEEIKKLVVSVADRRRISRWNSIKHVKATSSSSGYFVIKLAMDGPSVFHSAHKSLVGGSNERKTTGEERGRERRGEKKAEKEVFQLDARSSRNSCVSFTTVCLLDNGPRSPLSFLLLALENAYSNVFYICIAKNRIPPKIVSWRSNLDEDER